MNHKSNALGQATKTVLEQVDAEITRLENQLDRLHQVRLLLSADDAELKVINGNGIRRRLKYTHFTQVEMEQMVRMWNDLVVKRHHNTSTAVSRIAGVLKQPYGRVYKKMYHLAKLGKIPLNGIRAVREGGKPAFRENGKHRELPIEWTPELTERLLTLRKTMKPKEIAKELGIQQRQVCNKINKLKIKGKFLQ